MAVKDVISRDEAKASGLKTYFTGEPCNHGHIGNRMVSDARCQDCSSLSNQKKYGKLSAEQKTTLFQSRYARENERTRAKRRSRGLKHESGRDLTPEQRLANREAWKLRYADRSKTYQQHYYEERREAKLAYQRQYELDHPEETRANKRASEARRRAQKAETEGSFTSKDVEDLRRIQRNRCAGCQTKLKPGFHADHIVPLAKGGSNFRNNLQLLCPPCNHSKHARDPIEWAQKRGLLL